MSLECPTAQTCRVVTLGRRTGAEHVVTVWFAMIGTGFHAASRRGLAGDWVQNALAAGAISQGSGLDAMGDHERQHVGQ